jgi:hypothetical protein
VRLWFSSSCFLSDCCVASFDDGQSDIAAELGNEPRSVVAPLPAACRALDAQHIEAAD